MIILDMSMLSELMKPAPASMVVDWIAAQPVASLYTTSITQAEILHGIMVLPAGRRRRSLELAATSMFAEEFGGRILGLTPTQPCPTPASPRIVGGPAGPFRISTPRSPRLRDPKRIALTR